MVLMTTTTFVSQPTNSTAALFRDWGSKLSAAIAAVGFVKMADTGTIDWVTVAAPSAGNTAMGFEMWRFDDSLQATAPWFFKIEYGSSTAAATPSLWWTFGTGTNGSGSITGPLSARYQQSLGASTATNYTSYVCGLGSCLAISLWPVGGITNYARFVGVERSCDSSGVYNANAGIVVFKGASAQAYIVNHISKAYTNQFYPPVAHPTGASISALFPMTAMVRDPSYLWQPRMYLVGHPTDVGVIETVNTVPGFGTYMSTTMGYADAAAISNSQLQIVWS